jgi:TRAP transporter TAXI family solute receptor
MKKLTYKFILLVLISMVMFTVIAQTNAAEVFTFKASLAGATAGGGGVWDMFGAGLAEAIMRSNKGSVVTVTPGGSTSDLVMVSAGKAELGFCYGNIVSDAVKGNPPFEQKFENIRGLCALQESAYHFVVQKDGKIKSIDQIKKEKMPIKIQIGDPGSGHELASIRLLKAYGISLEDIVSWGGKVYHSETYDGPGMFADGVVDAFIIMSYAPVSAIMELANNHDLQILPIDDEIVQSMINDYGYAASVIPQSAYDFLSGDVKVFSSVNVVITSSDVPEEVIYNITRGLVENIVSIRNIHVNLSGLTIEQMSKNLGYPLHPGAEKYYKEIGVIR